MSSYISPAPQGDSKATGAYAVAIAETAGGVNNNGNATDSAGNVVVDFSWGNFPMQPNDERTTTADYTVAPSTVVVAANASQNYGWSGYTVYPSSRLNPTLSNHAVAEAKYAGFPAIASGDGAYISGTAYIQVPSVLGLTTALAIDALRDSGYESANITTASAATNSAKSIVTAERPTGAGTTEVTITCSAAHGYVTGNKVTIAGVDATVNGTWTVKDVSSTAFTFIGTSTAPISLGAGGTVVAVSGTIKSQSTAAGAASVATTATITVTPWA